MTRAADVFGRRRSGVLLHPTALPGAGARGNLGWDAYYFVDFLVAAGQTVWQVLPIGPTHDGSPYQSYSAFAGNPELISPQILRDWDWITPDELTATTGDTRRAVTLAEAGFRTRATPADQDDYEAFRATHRAWLDDFVLYQLLRARLGVAWPAWPAPVRERDTRALKTFARREADGLAAGAFEQFVFFRQWAALRRYAAERGVLLFGDLPIFLSHDSAELWHERQWFKLAADGTLAVEAGVPPDYYSSTGQHWGNPLYDWTRLAADGFGFWRRRLEHQRRLFDLVRIDHFRGFDACWEIPSGALPAEGAWVPTPGRQLFASLADILAELPLVAEDLGLITPSVHALREQFGLPGMRVLQFAFDGRVDNPYLPHNHERATVVYTGTHDNDTTIGWYESLAPGARAAVDDLLGSRESMPWALIRAALSSVAALAVLPMQDVLGLGAGHRFNTPGTTAGNWRWRFDWQQLTEGSSARLRHLTHIFGRA